jgi:hypothetical protein
MTVLNLCTKLKVPELCEEMFNRIDTINAQTESETLILNVLIPLLPQLRLWASQNNRNVDSMVQKIVGTWTKILGVAPTTDASLSNRLSVLARWTCDCQSCVNARNFLTKDASPTITLYRIGAVVRKHVEKYLTSHARGLATWDLVRSTPQSLSVGLSSLSCSGYHSLSLLFHDLTDQEVRAVVPAGAMAYQSGKRRRDAQKP